MPADLKKPFGPSCCDGGECNLNDMSAQPCGCDKGANWICQRHQLEATLAEYVRKNADHIDNFLEDNLFEEKKQVLR